MSPIEETISNAVEQRAGRIVATLCDIARVPSIVKSDPRGRRGLAPHGKNRARFRSGPSLPAVSRLLGMWLGARNNSREH
jgi:hypothetical protein